MMHMLAGATGCIEIFRISKGRINEVLLRTTPLHSAPLDMWLLSIWYTPAILCSAAEGYCYWATTAIDKGESSLGRKTFCKYNDDCTTISAPKTAQIIPSSRIKERLQPLGSANSIVVSLHHQWMCPVLLVQILWRNHEHAMLSFTLQTDSQVIKRYLYGVVQVHALNTIAYKKKEMFLSAASPIF